MNEFIKYLQDNKLGIVVENVDLAKHCTYRSGGIGRVLVEPFSIEDFLSIMHYISEHNINFYILGNGSNVILPDGNQDIVIIKLVKLSTYEIYDDYIEVQAGIIAPKLALELAYKGISGFEFLSGVPGTIGGCIFMNAGAYSLEVKDIIISVCAYDLTLNKLVTIDVSKMDYSYRKSVFQKGNYVILSGKFKYDHKDSEEIIALINDRRNRRVKSQPIGKAMAGSVFKNFVDKPAWQVIDECGLRGYRIGGASVSLKHCNMIVNDHDATSQDIIDLIEYIREIVYNKTNRELILEQKIVKWESDAKK